MEEKIKNITSEVYEELIKLFGKKIERIFLYGSYARGDFNLESDVDIMILLNCDQKDVIVMIMKTIWSTSHFTKILKRKVWESMDKARADLAIYRLETMYYIGKSIDRDIGL